MKDLLLIVAHLLTTLAILLGLGGATTIVVNSILIKQKLVIIDRSGQRAPNLCSLGQFRGELALQMFPHII